MLTIDQIIPPQQQLDMQAELANGLTMYMVLDIFKEHVKSKDDGYSEQFIANWIKLAKKGVHQLMAADGELDSDIVDIIDTFIDDACVKLSDHVIQAMEEL